MQLLLCAPWRASHVFIVCAQGTITLLLGDEK